MNAFLPQNLTKILLALGIVAFLLVGFFGVGLSGIHMGSLGQEMPGCPVMGMTVVCQMDPLEHIAAWQSMFVSALPNGILNVLAVLLAFLFFAFLKKDGRFLPLASSPKTIQVPRRVISIIRNPLADAFSNGILNPKIF